MVWLARHLFSARLTMRNTKRGIEFKVAQQQLKPKRVLCISKIVTLVSLESLLSSRTTTALTADAAHGQS